MVLPQISAVVVLFVNGDLTDGAGDGEVLRRRVIVSGHKALVHNVGELEELLSKVSRARGKKPAKVFERKLARSSAWDVVPELVLPVEASNELRKLLTLLSRDGKISRDDEDAVAVSPAGCSWDPRVRCVEIQVIAAQNIALADHRDWS